MYTKQAKLPVWRLVRGRDDRAEVLESYGIDSCDSERLPLAEACAQRGISFEEVRRALEACDRANDESAKTDWAGESMTNLAEHIVAWHHAYLRDQLPRLAVLMEKVVKAHSQRHPNLVELRELYQSIWQELDNHMTREEQALFPLVRELDQALRAQQSLPRPRGGSVRSTIRVMKDDHRSARDTLRRMRDLTFGFQAPGDACDCYRELMDGLAGLESDFHLQTHKEDNLLFPRVVAAAAALTAVGV